MPKAANAVALVFSEPNQNQAGEVRVMGTGFRYERASIHDMQLYAGWVGLYHILSSVSVFGPTTGASSLVIFGTGNSNVPDFDGPFVQLTNFHPQIQFDLNLSQVSFDNKAESMLLVHTQRAPEAKFSFRDMFLPQWNQFLANQMPSEVEQVGDPNLNWQPFPENISHLNSTHIYLKIYQELNIAIPGWADYAAYIAYWIQLTHTGGMLSGHVQRWEYWVESGLLTKVVAAIVEPNVKLGMNALNNLLQTTLGGLNLPVQDIYYLPGRQVNWNIGPGEHNILLGDTWDDVTIVIEMPPS